MLVAATIALLAALLAFGWYQRPAARAVRKVRRLEKRYFQKAHMPRHLAQESLDRHVSRLRERHPGRGPAWYVAQVVADLDRDRR